jgi:hypothetical protein
MTAIEDQARSVFLAALEHAPDQWPVFLDEACGGSGAHGPVKAGSTPTAPERPAGFDKVSIADIVTGGADPEDIECAREAAPGKVQSLGRIVSLKDHETETLALPGVATVSARWDVHVGVPAVMLRVLLESGREAEFEAVRSAIAHAQHCRGPDRHHR